MISLIFSSLSFSRILVNVSIGTLLLAIAERSVR